MLIGQQIGPFLIEKELGSGAMGTVYRAKFQREPGKTVPVALKVVALGLLGNEGAMARFDREANILKQLKHPHIVRLYATGHYRRTPFIAMEFIDGEALDRALARRGRLGWEEVVGYGRHLCDALQYAHEKGIIHRDLKPSNLMVTPAGVLKLTDFGIAKDTDVTALTGMNSTIGTAAYMSPEQCKGDKNLTNKSDLYSLGVVFFELLTGRKPFTADTTVDMFLKHVNELPPRVDRFVSDLPPKLVALILQLMQKGKDDRPVDALHVAKRLAEIEADAAARKSAGLAAATTRKADAEGTGGGAPVDAADREAARALRGDTSGVHKKKKKKRPATVPLLQRTWVKAAGLLLGLAALGAVAFLLTRPPSQDKLYAAVTEAGSAEEKLDKAKLYLEKYGEKDDERTKEVVKIYREGNVTRLEGQLAKRFGNKTFRGSAEGYDPTAYAAAMEALEAERAGDLDTVRQRWAKVAGLFPEEGKLSVAVDEGQLARAKWAWLAAKRLKELDDVRALQKQLDADAAKMAEFWDHKPQAAPGTAEWKALRATRLRLFGDADRAGVVWGEARDKARDEPDQRVVHLLATEQAAAAKPAMAPGARAALLREKLKAARAKVDDKESDGRTRRLGEARILARDVKELYDDLKDADVVVKEADALGAEIQAEMGK